MIDLSSFDLDYRPETYDFANAGAGDPEDDGFVTPPDGLDEWQQVYDGRFVYRPGEVTIASIDSGGWMGGVYYLTAYPSSGMIRYRFLDLELPEYFEDPPVFATRMRESTRPLSFRELITLLDSTKLLSNKRMDPSTVDGIWQFTLANASGETEDEIRAGLKEREIDSDLYPDLNRWYAAVTDHWLETGDILYVWDIDATASQEDGDHA